ncbi:MAG TPA: sulfite exporter TauE/SafE family protein [Candidatus Binatia bacterium]|nr:sulfite exporter TauE/SafE family protein [Candidatus Binatia bacterium]
MSLWEAAVLFAAAMLAGVVNSVAGGGSLISFPALVWAGIDPVRANATNTIAISPGALAAMAPFRRELRDMGSWLWMLGIPSVVGGGIGAVLLLATPERLFARLVPALILFATGVFALQEAIARRVGGDPTVAAGGEAPVLARGPVVAAGVQLAIAVYGGYFGAGIGIMMLAALGFLGLRDLHRMIGLRSFLGFCINGVASVYFAASGMVDWRAAALMTLGQVAGGYGGAAVARRVPRAVVRRAVVAIGLAMAASLFLTYR